MSHFVVPLDRDTIFHLTLFFFTCCSKNGFILLSEWVNFSDSENAKTPSVIGDILTSLENFPFPFMRLTLLSRRSKRFTLLNEIFSRVFCGRVFFLFSVYLYGRGEHLSLFPKSRNSVILHTDINRDNFFPSQMLP